MALAEDRVWRMMDALPDPVVAFEASLRVVYANHAALSFFGLGEKQIRDKYMVDLLGAENAVSEAASTIARAHRNVTLHDVAVNEKAVSAVFLTTVEAGALYLLTIRPQHIHLAQEWSASLKSAEAVAQTLAHEIKNPLAGIRGAAQLLEKSNLSPEDKELAALIARESQRIRDLTESFNVFHEALPQSEVNLHEVLNHVTQLTRAAYGDNVVIENKFDPSLPMVKGDFDHLVQAKLNLIKNAAEAFKGKKGKIAIRTFYDHAATPHPESAEKLPLCVEIEDDGHGIAPETLRRIFQPYFSTKPGGKGLGLPIVSKIVADHGGTVSVQSKPGKTVFRINLPRKIA